MILSIPSPIPGIVSTGLIFPFTYTCTEYFYHIQPPTHFPYILLPASSITPRGKKKLINQRKMRKACQQYGKCIDREKMCLCKQMQNTYQS
jgi:hypothetical protein